MADTAAAATKAKKHRSPAYPGINLKQAIQRAAEFYEKEHRNPASFNAAATHWGYGLKSSGALVAVAALKSFGLLNELESGNGRTFQLSPLGLRIVADKRPESTEREAAIREAALKPKIHAEIWRKYNGRLPSDAELMFRLENDWSFNTNSIASFIKVLRDTMAFAKVSESDNVSSGGDDSGENKIKAGDYVQWVSGGCDQFQQLKKVTALSEDGAFAFVEGSPTGLPVEELEVGEAPEPTNVPLPAKTKFSWMKPSPPRSDPNMRQDVFSLTEGEVVLMWPANLSQDSIADLKDWLKIVERKIARAVNSAEAGDGSGNNDEG